VGDESELVEDANVVQCEFAEEDTETEYEDAQQYDWEGHCAIGWLFKRVGVVVCLSVADVQELATINVELGLIQCRVCLDG
jgi:hypothetical protein